MVKLSKIALIVCWYGDYPWYFPYFIKSCAFNLTIDFIIITDNAQVIVNKPANVTIIDKTIPELVIEASDKLGFTVNMDYPYKLCDFRPAFGLIFSELLKGYDFWGHCDIDLVFGNIREFITEDLTTQYDVISSRHDYTTGAFCLFKNSDRVNKLFMQSRDYKMVFTSPEHYCFDECNFLFLELRNGASILDFPDRIQSMTYIVKRADSEGKLKAFFDFIIMEGTPGKIKWEKGILTYKNQFEVLLYHLIMFKQVFKAPQIIGDIPDSFSFTTRQIKTNLI